MTPPRAAHPEPHQNAARGPFDWVAAETAAWFGDQGPRLLYVAKAMLAAFTALWLAFRLELDSPFTALATTIILALPSSGMVLEKAFNRLLGTVVGCTASVILVALFPQAPALLLTGVALWVALCTGGAAMHRNQRSYSFVLAGYTACMIAVPAIDNPGHVFTLAVTRLTEVGLGIIVATVVHDVIFPRRHAHTVMRTVQARYASFIGFCQKVLEHRLSPADTELHHLKFAADIAALESGRAAAYFEAGHASAHTRQLHAFNAAFMDVLTTFYTVHRLIHRLRSDAAAPGTLDVLALVEPIHARMATALKDDLSAARMAQLRTGLAADIAAAQRQADATALDRPHRIDFDTALELLQRFARDLGEFAALYHGLTEDRRQQVSDPVAYTPRTPPAIVLASAFRAGATLLVAAGAWYWLAWPGMGNVILMATIFCALASSSPRPTAMVHQVLIGFLIAVPLSFVTEFWLVARADDFAPMVLATLPIFALGAYITTIPKWGGIGVGLGLFPATLLVPANQMRYDVESFLSSELSLVMGVVVAYVMFAVVLPEHTMGQRDHVAAALWREARSACTAGLGRLKRRFDNRVRDLLSQLNAAAGPAPREAARAVVRQGLTLLELGHAVIELRQLIAASPAGPVRHSLQQVVARVAHYLQAPQQGQGQAALDAILQAGAAIRAVLPDAVPERLPALHTALADLHAIYTSLLDQISTGETRHAA
ncbi:fusaric acid resistance protein [Duganella sp. Leaf126]|uniref:FUSC family protein n=1 Tax=Duganella sp. Leaf126 TaxID=1736266 RepID=UPI0006FCFBC7|nr:FUSC family protein [Duganella sp. Leaf126]KQQ46378.1 fusaric acid resistance protein [Duganella sp. Leaf126]